MLASGACRDLSWLVLKFFHLKAFFYWKTKKCETLSILVEYRRKQSNDQINIDANDAANINAVGNGGEVNDEDERMRH